MLELRSQPTSFGTAEPFGYPDGSFAGQSPFRNQASLDAKPPFAAQQSVSPPTSPNVPVNDSAGAPSKAAQSVGASTSARRPAYGWLMIPGLLLTLALAGGIGWFLHYSGTQAAKSVGNYAKPTSTTQSSMAKPPPVQPIETSTPAGPATATINSGNGSLSAGLSPEAPQSDVPSGPSSSRQAFSPAVVSDLLYRGRSPDWSISAEATPQVVEIDKDFIRFGVRSERDGFLYIFMLGSDTRDWWLIFPNGKDRNNKLIAGETLSLPRKSWPIQSGGPPGVSRFLAIASETERDFSASGLRLTRDFGKFDLAAAAQIYEKSEDPAALFGGKAKCTGTQSGCSNAYGAAQFQIEEVVRRLVPKKPRSNPSD